MSSNQEIIEAAFEDRAKITPNSVSSEVKVAVIDAIHQLDTGQARVAEKVDGNWVVNEWLKKAVLLSFRIEENNPMPAGFAQYYDKVPVKFSHQSEEELAEMGVRVVPPATARRGSYIAPDVVLMPSFREYRRLCRFRHHGRHLGYCRLVRANWKKMFIYLAG